MLGIHAASGTLYSLFYCNLHGPAGACISVASGSPIHTVFPIQRALNKHCGVRKHNILYIIKVNWGNSVVFF